MDPRSRKGAVRKPRSRWCAVALFVAVAFQTLSAVAQNKPVKEYQFQGSQIEGEREKPRDLYILPWQGTTLLDDSKFRLELLGGIEGTKDRYELEREASYFRQVSVRPE